MLISLTKCPGIEPIFLQLVLYVVMRTFVRFLPQFQMYLIWCLFLIFQATRLVRGGSEVCLALGPTLCARIVAFSSEERFSKNLAQDQQLSALVGCSVGILSCHFSLLSHWKWELYFPHLQAFGTNSVSPSVFTRREIQEQLTFGPRLHLHCLSDASSHFCQGCDKPLAAVRCVSCCKIRSVKIHAVGRS